MANLVLDISVHDEGIDLAAWKEQHNLWGVIIKLGGHEDAVGGRYADSAAENYYNTARALGLHIGFFYYTDTCDVAAANADADHFIQLIGDKEYDLPCYIDVEDPRQLALDRRKLTNIVKAFCDTLIYRGYYAGVYIQGSAWCNNVYSEELMSYANWIASWGPKWPTYAGDIGMWQQGCMSLSGEVLYEDPMRPGYPDLDWCCVDYPSRIQNGQKQYQPESHDDISPEPSDSQPTYGRASDVINAAYGELGYYAPDDPEPGSKYGRWLAELTGEDWLAGPSWEVFWCCMFTSWCLDTGNVQMDGFPTQNTDLALNGGAKKYAVDIYDVRYGDIVIFNWDWDEATDHIGFATGEFDGVGFTTIEGNVGNAVQEKYRQMGNVAWVLRPPYADRGAVGPDIPRVPTEPKNNRDGGRLEVDGIGGWNTIIDLQHIFGTYEDGWISGQYAENKQYHRGMSNVEYGSGGSPLVKAIQQKVGADADGHWGPNTSSRLQEWLTVLGYSLDIDGYFGKESVKALQQAINDGKLTV